MMFGLLNTFFATVRDLIRLLKTEAAPEEAFSHS